jgi:DNA-binding transcriptional ArsR family regulator
MPCQEFNIGPVSRALGDPTHWAVVEKLSESPLSVSRLAEPLDVTLAAVVQHLRVLEKSRLVHTEIVGGTHLRHRTGRAFGGRAMDRRSPFGLGTAD